MHFIMQWLIEKLLLNWSSVKYVLYIVMLSTFLHKSWMLFLDVTMRISDMYLRASTSLKAYNFK